MQVLMVFVLMIGVTVLTVSGIAGISFALGWHLHQRRGTRSGATERDPCAQCYADRDWYLTLPYWQHNAIAAWWWANRFQCVTKGCR